jgi:hypothetical protein
VGAPVLELGFDVSKIRLWPQKKVRLSRSGETFILNKPSQGTKPNHKECINRLGPLRALFLKTGVGMGATHNEGDDSADANRHGYC